MEFDFSTSQKVDDIQKVPQDFRGLYTEAEEGGYQLASSDQGVQSAVAAIVRMQKALKAARSEAKGNRVDLSPLADYGDNPETIAQKFQAQIEEIKASAGGKTDEEIQRQLAKIKEDLGKSHHSELSAREKRIEALTGQLHARIVTADAVSAMSAAKVTDPDLMMPFVERQVRVEEKDGKQVAHVVDANGDVRYSGVTGAPMSIAELVEEMKGTPKYAVFFASEAPSGSNRPMGGNRPTTAPAGTMSATDKIAAGLAKNQYQRGR